MTDAMARAARRRLLVALLALGTGLGSPGASRAAPPPPAAPRGGLPSRALRLVVGFPAGGGTDAIARLLAEPLRDALGVPVIVENRPGAGGQIAAQALRAGPRDGTMLLLSHDHTISILPLVTPDPGFDPDRDFVAVAGFATFVNAIALGPRAGVSTLGALLERGRNARVAIGVPAPASVPEFVVQALARRDTLDLVAVPYKGSAPMLGELAGGQLPAAVGSVPELIDLHRAGRARIVAVLGATRQPLLPEVPTLAELGIPGFEPTPYYGLFAPAGTPALTLTRTAAALARALEVREVRERLLGWGLEVRAMSGPELASLERRYREAWSTLIARGSHAPR